MTDCQMVAGLHSATGTLLRENQTEVEFVAPTVLRLCHFDQHG